MSKKDFDLREFDNPQSRNILIKTPATELEKTKAASTKTDDTKSQKVIVYMTRDEKQKFTKEAKKEKLSVSALIRHKLKIKNYHSF